MNSPFTTCRTLDEAKSLYRKLAMEHHPDHGGDEETMKEIVVAYEHFCTRFMGDAFNRFEAETERTAKGNVSIFASILARVSLFACRTEIIGYWIYCFDAFNVKDELKTLGFWFSKKHKAWIFSGGAKKKIRTKYTTDDVRAMHGSTVVDAAEQEAIA